MEEVSILEFRQQAQAIIQKVRKGKRLILTYRGKPAIRLAPLSHTKINRDDPFCSIGRLATSHGGSVNNEEIDRIIYET